jgi:hypothetical protein
MLGAGRRARSTARLCAMTAMTAHGGTTRAATSKGTTGLSTSTPASRGQIGGRELASAPVAEDLRSLSDQDLPLNS